VELLGVDGPPQAAATTRRRPIGSRTIAQQLRWMEPPLRPKVSTRSTPTSLLGHLAGRGSPEGTRGLLRDQAQNL
jgi:hypothetical protein